MGGKFKVYVNKRDLTQTHTDIKVDQTPNFKRLDYFIFITKKNLKFIFSSLFLD